MKSFLVASMDTDSIWDCDIKQVQVTTACFNQNDKGAFLLQGSCSKIMDEFQKWWFC